ncbi:hypothetical protein [Methylobacter luteus]|jgi:hypothetical protein|uniref:hypothetical protein n=1 Tax=Methylobacter luteus TaxID=415 RepID=UPI00040C3FBA|nr:hypothetical protein [Methylobacter luteus]
MSQSESDKILNKLLKEESNRFGWKCSRGFVFKKEKDAFFTILITGQPKIKRLSWSMRFKHYDFDYVFWDVVKLPENKKQPLSFRACGAWVAPSMEVQSGNTTLDKWEEEFISTGICSVFELLDPISLDVASSITSYQSNLGVLENYYSQLMKKYPNAVRTIWVEKLLTCLLESKPNEAKEIASARIAAGDSGGFNYEGSSFYQLANEYVDTSQNT